MKGIDLFVTIRCSGNLLCIKSIFDTLIQFFLEKSFVNTVQFCSCKFFLALVCNQSNNNYIIESIKRDVIFYFLCFSLQFTTCQNTVSIAECTSIMQRIHKYQLFQTYKENTNRTERMRDHLNMIE